MKLQTNIAIQPSKFTLDYNSNLLCLGSCFASHIGEKFAYYKFDILLNPFGVLFHPLAIEKLIGRAITGEKFEEDEFFQTQGLWHHFDLHSSFSHPDKDIITVRANAALIQLKTKLEKATHLFITLGTSWVYRLKETQKIVANCHKLPQAKFSKTLLGVQEIQESLGRCSSLVKKVNPSLIVVYTLSPVRHLKDGFIENQQSKAHLLTAIHQQRAQYANCTYFPSYEIVLDELRDYRFYKEDMIHPSELAIHIIWEKFKEGWIDASAIPTMKQVHQIQQGLNHRPFNSSSQAYKKFKASLQASIEKLSKKHPHISFEA